MRQLNDQLELFTRLRKLTICVQIITKIYVSVFSGYGEM